MNPSLTEVLAKAGLTCPEVLPFSHACGLCQTNDALEVRSAFVVTCHHCGFVGDWIEYYAAVSRQCLSAAVAELTTEGLLDFGEPEVVNAYLHDRETNRMAIQAFRAGQERLKGGAARDVLQALGILWNDPNTITRLAPNHAAVRAEDFEDVMDRLPKSLERGFRSLGLYTALAVPCWRDSVLTGLFIFQPAKFGPEAQYIRLCEDGKNSIAYGLNVGLADQCCVVCQDPTVALRMMARQTLDADRPVPFVVPMFSTHETMDQIACQKVIYFPYSPGHLDHPAAWYGRAIKYAGGSLTIPEWTLMFSPLTQWPVGQTSRKLIAKLEATAVPSYQAIGSYLLRQKAPDAAKTALALKLTLPDQNQVLTFFSGSDAIFLRRAFEVQSAAMSVMVDGQKIVESRAGWTCDGKMVSEAVMRFDELRTDRVTNQSMVSGTVSFTEPGSNQTRVEPFREDLEQIEKNAAAWLKRFVRACGGWAEVNPRWSGRLIPIAKQFSLERLVVVSVDKPFGWDQNKTLRYPRFSIDRKGVHRAAFKVVGPDIPYPNPLVPAEYDNFGDATFCRTILALMGNLYLTSTGRPGYALAIPSAPHLVERIANSFGLKADKNPNLRQLEREARSPLPRFCTWSDDELARVMREPHAPHVMTSVDQQTFRLLACRRDWIRLPIEGLTGFESLRWCLTAMPILLADGFNADLDNGFFSEIAKRLSPLVGEHKSNHKLSIAGTDLDGNWLISDCSAGTMVLRLIRQLVDSGDLPFHEVEDGFEVRHADVIAAFQSPVMPAADIANMTAQLTQARLLTGLHENRWVVSGIAWVLGGTYAR